MARERRNRLRRFRPNTVDNLSNSSHPGEYMPVQGPLLDEFQTMNGSMGREVTEISISQTHLQTGRIKSNRLRGITLARPEP